MNPEKIEKLFIQALGDKTVLDIIETETYLEILTAQLDEQKMLRKAARDVVFPKRPQAHVVDTFVNMTGEQFRDEVLLVLDGKSKRPFRERRYIRQLSKVAYDETCRQIVAGVSPEYAEWLASERSKGTDA